MGQRFLGIYQVIFLFVVVSVHAQTGPPAIRLERSGAVVQLTIDGRPFLVLGGELGNSSASDMEYL